MVDVAPGMDLDALALAPNETFRGMTEEDIARYRRAQAVSMAWVHVALTLPGPVGVSRQEMEARYR